MHVAPLTRNSAHLPGFFFGLVFLPSIVTLRAMENVSSSVPIDGVVHYLVNVAETVITLGQAVLDTR